MTETAETVLSGVLAARLADVWIDPEEDRVRIDDREITGSDPIALRAEIATVLYELWHSGAAGREAGRPVRRREAAFERELAAAAPHRESATSATVRALPDTADPEHALAEVNRVRVLVPAAAVSGLAPGDTAVLDLPALRPMLSPGFLLATGAAGGHGGGDVLRLYVHVAEARHAAVVWSKVLETLEGCGARYRAKVLSYPESYPRRDAIVVYLPEESWRYVSDLVGALKDVVGLGEATSVLAHRIGPGLAMAWEPADDRPGWRRVSFGQHRARAVARGVVRCMSDGESLNVAVAEELKAAGVDPANPARNLASPEFPVVGAAADLTAVPA